MANVLFIGANVECDSLNDPSKMVCDAEPVYLSLTKIKSFQRPFKYVDSFSYIRCFFSSKEYCKFVYFIMKWYFHLYLFTWWEALMSPLLQLLLRLCNEVMYLYILLTWLKERINELINVIMVHILLISACKVCLISNIQPLQSKKNYYYYYSVIGKMSAFIVVLRLITFY